MPFDLKTAALDQTFPDLGILFGADSQSAEAPSVYTAKAVVSKSVSDMADTWNNGATTFTAIKMDVTDTASASGSLLMDLQVGGSSKFKIDKNGSPFFGTATKRVEITDPYGFRVTQGGILDFSVGNSAIARLANSGWCTDVLRMGRSIGYPTVLTVDGAHILAQRNGTNAQAFNLYNTYTNSSNYERATFRWNANALEIKPEAAGTGTTRVLHISGLPTANPGPGILWNDAGTVKVGT
ncbi:hypothetical protein [Roseicyclus amphidinii]|uniref:hypothetical protein n=1 Tax=Roseicyclus amphidinii TaxID=3034232 RepID=UPI0024E140E3|nr:hypothetical protein [Roseicyclus sp. Amp-Y-6]